MDIFDLILFSSSSPRVYAEQMTCHRQPIQKKMKKPNQWSTVHEGERKGKWSPEDRKWKRKSSHVSFIQTEKKNAKKKEKKNFYAT